MKYCKRLDRAAIYVRNDFEAKQERLCLSFLDNHKAWILKGIYRDDEFSGMIKACEEDEIDIIITKSFDRFSRDAKECLGTTLKLMSLKPPTDVHFISENISTRNKDDRTYISTMKNVVDEATFRKCQDAKANR